MAKKHVDPEIQTIVQEAEDDYDLRKRLTVGSANLKKTVTVYTDAVTGRELGGAEDVTDRGIIVGRRRWGVLGKVDELEERTKALLQRAEKETRPEAQETLTEEAKGVQKELTALRRKIAPLTKKLDSTALVFNLVAIPDFILEGARRRARKNLGIKQKGIPQDQQSEFNDELTCVALADSVDSWTDNADGKVRKAFTVDQARDLRGFLPPGQWPKLDIALYELSIQASIGKQATDSADF